MANSRTIFLRTSNVGTLPSFSILYKYRYEIPTRAVSSSTVKSDLSRAVLMISPSVSGRFCTVRSPPYIIIWIPFMLIMAQPFNYWWTQSAKRTELNTNTAPPNKKNEALTGCRNTPISLKSEFWSGGIFYALDSTFGNSARQKPPIWFACITDRLPGEPSKKAFSRHRDIIAHALNQQTIINMN